MALWKDANRLMRCLPHLEAELEKALKWMSARPQVGPYPYLPTKIYIPRCLHTYIHTYIHNLQQQDEQGGGGGRRAHGNERRGRSVGR